MMRRFRLAGLAAVALLQGSPARAVGEERSFRVTSSDQVETVFSWKADRCADDQIPDSAARALREPDGGIVVILPHYMNRLLVGGSFDTLKPRCEVITAGREDPRPEKFDDRYWIEGWFALDKKHVVGLASDEYSGGRHPGQCDVSIGYPPHCWYSSIIQTESFDSGLHFQLAPLASRVVAAPPVTFDPTLTHRVGFFTTSNIVQDGSALLFASWQEIPGNRPGNCLFRLDRNQSSAGWLALTDGAFKGKLASPYVVSGDRGQDSHGGQGHGCDVIGADRLKGPLRSIVRLTSRQLWMGAFQHTASKDEKGPHESGTFITFSRDLITWSSPVLLFPSRQPWGQPDCAAFYDYPSLIDHDSASNSFDVSGDNLYLYLTRFNFESCKKGLDRDLVRMKIKIT
jgi:hypothetical protein